MTCNICGSPLNVVGQREVLGKVYDIVEDCQVCLRRAAEKEEAEKLEAIKTHRREMYDSLIASNVGRKYYRVMFDTVEMVSESFEKARARAQKYCEVHETCKEHGYGIYFYGDNGRGKTALMACMIHELIRLGNECYITSISELGDNIINKRVDLEKVKNIAFLFLDDIGSEKTMNGEQTTWLNDKLFEIVAHRDKGMLPTIFSSNVQPSDLLKNGVMKKTVERISSMSTAKLEIVTDNSYRSRKTESIPF